MLTPLLSGFSTCNETAAEAKLFFKRPHYSQNLNIQGDFFFKKLMKSCTETLSSFGNLYQRNIYFFKSIENNLHNAAETFTIFTLWHMYDPPFFTLSVPEGGPV